MKIRLLILLVLLPVCHLYGQNSENFGIRTVQISSEILNEEREILLFNTSGKQQEPNQLPTIYLLDGRENLLLVAGILSNLVRADLLPDVNLVGINTYDYDREYNLSTKSNSSDIGFESGGAENFQKFITGEVFPYINSSLSTSKYKVLVGHSFGGSFGLNMILESPQSFSSAILIDPSIWWNNGQFIEEYRKNSQRVKNVPIYYSHSGSDPESISLFNNLERLANNDNSRFDRFSDENHISTLSPSISNGLKYIFKDFSSLENRYEAKDFVGIKSEINALNTLYDMEILPKVRPVASMARSLTREGKYSESISILSYLEQFHPESIMVLNFLGEAYQQNGDLNKAKITYTKSLKVARSKKSPMVKWIEKRLTEVNK